MNYAIKTHNDEEYTNEGMTHMSHRVEINGGSNDPLVLGRTFYVHRLTEDEVSEYSNFKSGDYTVYDELGSGVGEAYYTLESIAKMLASKVKEEGENPEKAQQIWSH